METVFKSPGPKPNGLQATRKALDSRSGQQQGISRQLQATESSSASLQPESDRGSGITFDGEALWIGSTYNREIVRCDAKTGKTLARYFTPGAGVIYKTTWDPPARSSPLAKPPAQPAKRSRPNPRRQRPIRSAPARTDRNGVTASSGWLFLLRA